MIRLEALRVRAGDFLLAIDELSVAPGEYVMVLGPTASGKTVLLETIAGLRRPEGGWVWFGERDVTGASPEKRGTGLVYQDYALFPHLTVAENISFGLGSHRSRKSQDAGERRAQETRRGSRTKELAAMLGIDGLLDRYPEGLSGGEQQRVALARALAIEPEVLLLDEPLSALDGATRADLQRELARIHGELGATVMHVTHDLDEALALGDRMAVLMGGRLCQVGAPDEVTRHPADTDVARLVGFTNLFPIAALARGGVSLARGRDDADTTVRLANGPGLVVGEAAASLAAAGLEAAAAARAAAGGPVATAAAAATPGLAATPGPDTPADPAAPVERAASLFVAIRAEEIELTPLDTTPASTAGASFERQDGDGANVINGVTTSVLVQSVHAAIEVEVPPRAPGAAPLAFTVHVLRPEVERMGITPGLDVRLRIPVSAVHICRDAGHGG